MNSKNISNAQFLNEGREEESHKSIERHSLCTVTILDGSTSVEHMILESSFFGFVLFG